MNNITATRTLLRQGLRISQIGRISTRPITCQSCTRQRPVLATRSRRQSDEARALFHSTPIAHKKKKNERGGGGKSNSKEDSDSGSSESGDAEQEAIDVMDFSDVKQRLGKHGEYFKDALKKISQSNSSSAGGGRFSPESLGAIAVVVDRRAGTSYPLCELAVVVPRGPRAVSLIAHDEAFVKPIMSAIQNNDAFNQQPQRVASSDGESDDEGLELRLKVEPESPADLVKRARAAANDWRDRIRFVRHARSNLLNGMQQKGLILPDVKRAASKELEKIVKAALAEVDAAEKTAMKAAESK